MKDFNDFREYLKESDIQDVLHHKIESIDNDFQNSVTHSDNFSLLAVMEILERYHHWLNAGN